MTENSLYPIPSAVLDTYHQAPSDFVVAIGFAYIWVSILDDHCSMLGGHAYPSRITFGLRVPHSGLPNT